MSRKRKLYFVYGGYAFYDLEHFFDFAERNRYVFSDEKTSVEKPFLFTFTKEELKTAYDKRAKTIGRGSLCYWVRLPQRDRNVLANLKKGTHFGKGIAHKHNQMVIVEDPVVAKLFLNGNMHLPISFDYVSDIDKNFIMVIYNLEDMKHHIHKMIQSNNEKPYRRRWLCALDFFTQGYKYFGRKRVCKLVDTTKSLANQMPKSIK